MAFMKIYIQRAEYFSVETNQGTEIVPAEVVRLPFAINFKARGVFSEDNPEFPALQRALSAYVSGDGISEVSPGQGYIARLSAPGYMDCADWSAHDSEEEARDHLAGMYGDDETEEG